MWQDSNTTSQGILTVHILSQHKPPRENEANQQHQQHEGAYAGCGQRLRRLPVLRDFLQVLLLNLVIGPVGGGGLPGLIALPFQLGCSESPFGWALLQLPHGPLKPSSPAMERRSSSSSFMYSGPCIRTSLMEASSHIEVSMPTQWTYGFAHSQDGGQHAHLTQN